MSSSLFAFIRVHSRPQKENLGPRMNTNDLRVHRRLFLPIFVQAGRKTSQQDLPRRNWLQGNNAAVRVECEAESGRPFRKQPGWVAFDWRSGVFVEVNAIEFEEVLGDVADYLDAAEARGLGR